MAVFKKLSALILATVFAVACLVLTSCGGNQDPDKDPCADGHSYGEYVSDGNATCTADGTKTAKCANCDKTNTVADTGSKLAHNYVDGECTECGEADPDAPVDPEDPCKNGHTWGAYTSNGDATCTANGTETAKCTNCDKTDTREVADSKLSHSYGEYVSDGNATCTSDGTKSRVCSVCENKDTVVVAGSKLDHNYVDGECTECGEADPDAPVDPDEPIEDEVTYAEGTPYYFGYDEKGTMKYLNGENAGGKNFRWDLTDNADEAAEFFVEKTEGGYYVYFEKDGAKVYLNIVKSGTYINLLADANALSVWAYDSDLKALAVEVDGANYVPKSYNNYGNVEAKKFDYTNNDTYVLSFFEIKEEPVDPEDPCKNGHTWGEYTSNGDATCTADGTKTAECENCDETNTVADTGSKLAHNYVDGECTECGEADPDAPVDPEIPDLPEIPEIEFTSAGIVIKDFTVEINGQKTVANVEKMYVTLDEYGQPFGYGKAQLVFSGEPLELPNIIETEIVLESGYLYIVNKGAGGFNSTQESEQYVKVDVPQALDALISQAYGFDFEQTLIEIAGIISYIQMIYPEIEDIIINKIIPALGTFEQVEDVIASVENVEAPEGVTVSEEFIRAFFDITETEDSGVALTLKLDALKAANEILATSTISELIDLMYGEGAYESIKSAVPGLLAYSVADVVAMIEENGGSVDQLFDAIDEIIAIVVGAEGVTLEMLLELDMDIAEMLKSEEMQNYSVARALMIAMELESTDDLMAGIEYAYSILESATLYDLIAGMSQSAPEEYPEDMPEDMPEEPVDLKTQIDGMIDAISGMVFCEIEFDAEGNVVYCYESFDMGYISYSVTYIDGVVEIAYTMPVEEGVFVSGVYTFADNGAADIEITFTATDFDTYEQYNVIEAYFELYADGEISGTIEVLTSGEKITIEGNVAEDVNLAVTFFEGEMPVASGIITTTTDENGVTEAVVQVMAADEIIQAAFICSDEDGIAGVIVYMIEEEVIFSGDFAIDVTDGILFSVNYDMAGNTGNIMLQIAEDGSVAGMLNLMTGAITAELSGNVNEAIIATYSFNTPEMTGTVSIEANVSGACTVVADLENPGFMTLKYEASVSEDGSISVSNKIVSVIDGNVEMSYTLDANGVGTIYVKQELSDNLIEISGSFELLFGEEFELDIEAAEAIKAKFDAIPEIKVEDLESIFGSNNNDDDYGDGDNVIETPEEKPEVEEIIPEEKEETEEKTEEKKEPIYSVDGGSFDGLVGEIITDIFDSYEVVEPIYDGDVLVGVKIISYSIEPYFTGEFNELEDGYMMPIYAQALAVNTKTIYFDEVFALIVSPACGGFYSVDGNYKYCMEELVYPIPEGAETLEDMISGEPMYAPHIYYGVGYFDYCYDAQTGEIVENAYHDYEWDEANSKNPTKCGEIGCDVYVCVNEGCGKSYKYYYEKSHNVGETEITGADGYYVCEIKCSDCDETVTKNVYIDCEGIIGFEKDEKGCLKINFEAQDYTEYRIEASGGGYKDMYFSYGYNGGNYFYGDDYIKNYVYTDYSEDKIASLTVYFYQFEDGDCTIFVDCLASEYPEYPEYPEYEK